MADLIWFLGENGSLSAFDADLIPEGIQHRLDRGDLVLVTEDGSPLTEAIGELDGPVDIPPPDAPPLPKRTAHRRTWIDFAVSHGMDREKANNLTKAELVDTFTSEPEPSGS